jgi:hypothetical protein
MPRICAIVALLSVVVLGYASEALSQSIEIAGFGGYGFGGALASTDGGRNVSIEGGLVYGGTLTGAISPSWRIEALVSRQESHLAGDLPGTQLDAVLSRYMAGIQEEKGQGRTRAFGTFLVGATRFDPSGYEAQTWFTLGLGLGVKTRLASHLGLRFEARGYYTPVDSGGGVACSGGRCIFAFSGSGLFQGDVSGGVLVAF